MRLRYSTLKEIEQIFGDDFSIEAGNEHGSNKLSYMLRFGYWAEIELEDLKSIFEPLGFTVKVSEWEDDDCGWLYSYNITQPSLEEIQKQFQNK